ncbi:MAG: hypothetical protein ACI9C4_000972 [Paraglaciecola sp.]
MINFYLCRQQAKWQGINWISIFSRATALLAPSTKSSLLVIRKDWLCGWAKHLNNLLQATLNPLSCSTFCSNSLKAKLGMIPISRLSLSQRAMKETDHSCLIKALRQKCVWCSSKTNPVKPTFIKGLYSSAQI